MSEPTPPAGRAAAPARAVGSRAGPAAQRPAAVPVAIVGAGPVGLVLALLLERLGVACAVLEARTEPYPLPRAVHLDDEALRVLAEVGVRAGLATRPLDGMALVDRGLRPLVSIDRARRPLGEPASVLMHQPELEAALRARAVGLLRSGARVVGLRQDAHGVELALEDGEVVAADWVVGCDGASSTIRGLTGIGVDDRGFRQDWLVVDLLISHDGGHPARVLQVCDPSRPATSVPVGAGRHRIELRLAESEREPDVVACAAELVAPLADRLGLAVRGIERAAVYEFRGRVARAWRRGRVLLAGDAAHEMPPFLGQGLCTGLRDAANLAWKLAYVLDGRAEPALLDTYAAERLPHARLAIDLTAAVGRVVSARRRLPSALRDRLLAGVGRVRPFARFADIGVPPLPHAALVADGGGRPLSRPQGAFEPQPGAFCVLGLGAAPDTGLPGSLRRWWERLGAVLAVADPPDGEDPGLLVIRPDGMVLARYRPPSRGQVSPLADLAVRLSAAGLRARGGPGEGAA